MYKEIVFVNIKFVFLQKLEFIKYIMTREKSGKIIFIIAGIIVLLGVIGDINYKRNKTAALKDGVMVKGIIVEKRKARGTTIIYVGYDYEGVRLQSDFSAPNDTFKINEEVILKISKQKPGEYVEFIDKAR